MGKQEFLDWWDSFSEKIFHSKKEREEKPSVKVYDMDENGMNLEDSLVRSQDLKPMVNGRFAIDFKGIRPYYFNSYKYLSTDIHSQKKLLTSKKVVVEDFSSFQVILCEKEKDGYDVCKEIKNLEVYPKIGDVKVIILNETGLAVKTILIPDCEVTEIRAFRELGYSEGSGVLYGEITVKHKQRKLLSDDEQREG